MSAEAKGTPGPWRMAGRVGNATWIDSETNPNIAAVHGAATKQGNANARLIAAAPALRDALKPLADWPIEHVGGDRLPDDRILAGLDGHYLTVGHVRAARAALAKAGAL